MIYDCLFKVLSQHLTGQKQLAGLWLCISYLTQNLRYSLEYFYRDPFLLSLNVEINRNS